MAPVSSRKNVPESGVSDGKQFEKDSIELKRAKGEISCAECRRLKLRCDKKLPCSSCVRRGCPMICPNGVLTSGVGSRFILADTDKLHRKITEMSNRIRQLEDALANAQSTISRDPHPMLAPDLLAIKHKLPSSTDDTPQYHANTSDRVDGEIMNSFEDLTLSESDASGEALFLPNVYNRELPQIPESSTESTDEGALPVDIEHLSSGFPFSPLHLPKDDIQKAIEARLPTYERASDLCDQYIQYAAWWIRPVGYDQIHEELMPAAYHKETRGSPMGIEQDSGKDDKKMDPHDLAVLLMVFAMGSTGCPTTDSCSEGELYLNLARAALCLKPVLEFPSVAVVQAICLMASFDMIPRRAKSLEPASKTVSFATMLAVTIGLHKDPSHWKFDPKIAQRRREIFWELLYVDAWKSIASGRPTGVHPDDIDCEFPFDKEASLDEDGQEVPSFWRVKYQYLRDVFLEVVRKLNFVKPLRYSEILELDGKVHEFGPKNMEREAVRPVGSGGTVAEEDIRTYLQKYMLSLLKDITLQLLHRNFFARALMKNPRNPMESPFASSFLSCYNSAISILRVVRDHYDGISTVIMPYWSCWTFTPISGIILGSVAAYAPMSELSPRAYVDLVLSIDGFEQADFLPLIRAALPVILRLRDRAYDALTEIGKEPDKLVEELGAEYLPSEKEDAEGQARDDREGSGDNRDDEPGHTELSDTHSDPTSSQNKPTESSTAGGAASSPSDMDTTPRAEEPEEDPVPSAERTNTDYRANTLSFGFDGVPDLETSLGLGSEEDLLHSTPFIDHAFQSVQVQGWSPTVQTNAFPTIDSDGMFGLQNTLLDPPLSTPSSNTLINPSLSTPSSFSSSVGLSDLASQIEDALNGSGAEINSLSSAFSNMQDSDFIALLSMSLGEDAPFNGMADAQQGLAQFAPNAGADADFAAHFMGGDDAQAGPSTGPSAQGETFSFGYDDTVIDNSGRTHDNDQQERSVTTELDLVFQMYGW